MKITITDRIVKLEAAYKNRNMIPVAIARAHNDGGFVFSSPDKLKGISFSFEEVDRVHVGHNIDVLILDRVRHNKL